MSSLIDRARWFAVKAHAGQTRKYTGEPYWHHCRNVAKMVQERTDNDVLVAAAWLHDTIEDTDTTAEDIWDNFPECYALVCGLTDMFTAKNYPDLNRKERKKLEAARLGGVAKLFPGLREIKLCDMIDNTKSIIEHDPKFSIVYLREKAYLLEQLGYGK